MSPLPTLTTNLISFFVIASAALMAQTGAPPANVHGSVADQAGHPIPNATIRYVRQPRYLPAGTPKGLGQTGKSTLAPGEVQLDASVQSDVSGKFQVSSLPAGDYLLCAYAPGFLDSCKWDLALGASGISPGETRNLNAIRLIPATKVTVQISDPLGLLSSKVQPGVDSGLILGVKREGGAFLPSTPQIVTGGRTYQFTIPYDTPLTVWVYSRSLRLADSQNNALAPAGAGIPLQVVSGATAGQIAIRVTGRK